VVGAEALARLASRGPFTGEDDLVFVGIAGGYLDGSALYRRYKVALRRAGLRSLCFHDLRHRFGTQVISNPAVSILRLKAWMGHADIDTTMKYLHYAPRDGEADLVRTRSHRPVSMRRPCRTASDASNQLLLRNHDRDVLR
jgi:integrase